MNEVVNPMLKPRVTKITLNIGVGEGGKRLELAEKVITLLTGLTPVRTLGKIQNRDLKVRKGAPIGCKVTIRNSEQMSKFLKDAFWVRENTLPIWNFDSQGNLSFGIRDYTDFPGQKYNPDIGIFGMDVNVVLERPGHRVFRRRRNKAKVGKSHRVSKLESVEFFASEFGLKIVEE